MDDDFMTRCFEDDAECTELVLHIIMEQPDLKVIESRTQYGIKNLQGRSVRLDVFATDSAGRKYNIEIQRDASGAGARRARYNSSLIDANLLKPGEQVQELPETYVIFITEYDIIGKNRPVYHIDRYIKETGDIFKDGAHILYVNGAYRDETPLGRLMYDFSCSDPADMHYSVLADRVRYFKENEEGVGIMSVVVEDWMKGLVDELVKEALEKAVKEAVEEAVSEQKEEMARNLIEEGNVPFSTIAKCTGFTLEEIKKLAEIQMV